MSLVVTLSLIAGSLLVIIALYFMSPILSALFSALSTIVQGVGRVLSFAPSWMKVGFFVLMMAFMSGFVVNWFFAADKVCLGGVPYTGPVGSSMLAKGVPEGQVTSEADLGKFNRIVTFLSGESGLSKTRWGTFYVASSDPQVRQTDFVKTGQLLAMPYGSNGSTFKKAGDSIDDDFAVCRITNETRFRLFSLVSGAWFNNDVKVNAGHCYLMRGGCIGSISDTQASFTYRIKYDGNTVKFTGNDADFNQPNVPGSGTTGLSQCMQINARDSDNKGTIFLVNPLNGSDSGYVHASYVNVLEGLDANTTIAGSTNARKTFMGTDFSQVVQNDSSTLTYGCSNDGEDNVTILLWGFDIFNWENMVILIAMVAILGLLKWIGLF